jgi:hypothetical protein
VGRLIRKTEDYLASFLESSVINATAKKVPGVAEAGV